ncbi:GL19729 [Drosophila persimilis]|uniref:nucleoside-diphosphate kinase n=1 Tax=Drosophila persimilis TaxID=7234 RepID=B4HB20_DROPE|nr:GL19729 [Drosophila persimilis]
MSGNGLRNDKNPGAFSKKEPGGLQRGLAGQIIERFVQKGFKLVALKSTWASKELLKKHHADLSVRPFFRTPVQWLPWSGRPLSSRLPRRRSPSDPTRRSWTGLDWIYLPNGSHV